MTKNKIIFFTIWLLTLSIGIFTVIKSTPLSLLKTNQILLVNFIQRILGLTAFTLLFFQIILGAFMNKLTEKLGGWIFSWHKAEGVFTYLIILLHPLMYVLLLKMKNGILDPFYVYLGFCVICRDIPEYFYNFGRIGFWLLTIGVSAALLRTQPWLTRYWRYFHIFNYFAFASIAIHSWFVGTDTHSAPFVYFYWLAVLGVISSFVYRRFIFQD